MKFLRLYFSLVLLIFISHKALAIEAFVQPVIFYTPTNQPYTEIRIFISNKGFSRIPTKDSNCIYRATITLMLKRGTYILNAEKIVLTSPEGREPGPLIHQLRWPLDGRDCELETKIEDEQNTSNELTLINKLSLYKTDLPFLSEIQLSIIAKASTDSNQVLYKNGIYSEPLIYHHYNAGQNILYGYFESYATKHLGKPYILKFIVSKKDSAGNFKVKEEWYKKRTIATIDPYLLKHDISSFITGTYKLTIQILDLKFILQHEQSIEFTRDNPFWDKIDEWARTKKEDKYYFDTLAEATVDYSIRSMYPLISSLDASVLDDLFKDKKMEEKRVFLFAYWSEKGNAQKSDARAVFKLHLELVREVDKLFYSGFGYGFETDRGRIYLKYGKPNEVIAEDKDNGAYPYEIWKYAKIDQTGQTNVKFLFYNPDLAGSDFRLLHSTAHGERQNRKWEIELYKNAPKEIKGANYLDAEEMQSNYNRRAREYFKY
jgi:GWxTD domain-containing protein